MFMRRRANCGCLNDTACYNAILELSLRLRRATDVISRSPSHSGSFDCTLHARITDLDTFVKNSLLDAPSYDSSLTTGLSCSDERGAGRDTSPNPPTVFDHSYGDSSGSGWDMSALDSFMSWVPAHARNV
ncbi:hypothetical protein C8R44DRAFT_791113 [Mycena epipterygia]|nr:hypothetical protein C8R44DRAFT_791113 [Mycena epipterygia]